MSSVFTVPGNTPWTKPPSDNGARDTVVKGFSTAQEYARGAVLDAHVYLDSMANEARALTLPLLAPELSMPPMPAPFQAPQLPDGPAGMNLTLPGAPAEPTLAPVALLTLPNTPVFDAAPLPLNLPTAPLPLNASVPTLGALPDVAIPGAPNIALPDVPSLVGITIPAAPALNLPSFGAVLGAAPDAPANVFAFAEPTYTSSLLDTLRARLAEWVGGAATGLAPAVEQAIWERGRARENALLARKTGQALREFAARGFAKPPGALATALGDALQDTQGTLAALSRDVMIKQAELEQSNRQFAFDTAFKVETELITYQNLIAQRGFDAARYAQQVGLDIFQAMVARFGAQVNAYQTEAVVFKTRIEGELAKLEVYKTELEGQKLIGEINLQAISVYQARISGALAQVELFKNQVMAANLMLDGNKVRIEGFAATVSAYDATVRAKATEYQGYATAASVEGVKVELFKGQAEAFRSQAEAFRSTVEAVVAQKNSEIEVSQKMPLDAFKVRTDVFRTRVEAETARAGALLRQYEVGAQVFGTEVSAEAARTSAEAATFKTVVEANVSAATLAISAGKANLELIVKKAELLLEAVKAGAQVSAQLAASALSAVNLSAQLGAHTNDSAQNSANNGTTNHIASQIGDVTYHNLKE